MRKMIRALWPNVGWLWQRIWPQRAQDADAMSASMSSALDAERGQHHKREIMITHHTKSTQTPDAILTDRTGTPTPEPAPFAIWWTDLEEYAQRYGVSFSRQQAQALYERATRTPAPVPETGESEVQE